MGQEHERDPFEELKAPFDNVKTKTLKGQTITYITARQVMDRLDEVVGPENWRDEYQSNGKTVACGLSIRIDGEWITKWDIGTESNWEPAKGAFSDALKRAAVRWGVGRYLYGDGEACAPEPPKPGRSDRRPPTTEKCQACYAPAGKPHATGCPER